MAKPFQRQSASSGTSSSDTQYKLRQHPLMGGRLHTHWSSPDWLLSQRANVVLNGDLQDWPLLAFKQLGILKHLCSPRQIFFHCSIDKRNPSTPLLLKKPGWDVSCDGYKSHLLNTMAVPRPYDSAVGEDKALDGYPNAWTSPNICVEPQFSSHVL